MGQRSQIIIIAPHVFLNKDNPNNNNGAIYISHNQWRYGSRAIIVLADVIKKLKYFIKEEGANGYTFLRLGEYGTKAVRYAENHRLDWDFSQSDNFEKHRTEWLTSLKTPLSFLKQNTDNNNGWFLINVDKKGKISFGILNGIEESPVIKSKTPKEYLNYFKDPEIIIKGYKETLNEALEFLSKFENVDPLKEIAKLKTKLNKTLMKKTVNNN